MAKLRLLLVIALSPFSRKPFALKVGRESSATTTWIRARQTIDRQKRMGLSLLISLYALSMSELLLLEETGRTCPDSTYLTNAFNAAAFDLT